MPDANETSPRTVAFYLPQFHAIPENDEWWGEGFTEWTNVRRAKAWFHGHDHPRVPAQLGYYDLSQPEVMLEQVEMAREAHVDAFCFYFYWFDGRRLLESPVDWFRDDGPDFPYCLSWANEPWTRRWDGKSRHVLMGQSYADGFADRIFEDFLPHFLSSKYLRASGKPVLLVHRVTDIPNPRAVSDLWRNRAVEAGLPGLYLIATETKPGVDPVRLGFDAAVEFPPVGSNTLGVALTHPLRGLEREFRGRLFSYERMAHRFMKRPRPRYVCHRGVAPGWDNTARRGANATVYVGDSPMMYQKWLGAARADEYFQRGSQGLVFVNAWNEWAEGAYLEPDVTNGDSFLLATRRDAPLVTGRPGAPPKGRWGARHARSLLLALASSVLSWGRRLEGLVRRGGPT